MTINQPMRNRDDCRNPCGYRTGEEAPNDDHSQRSILRLSVLGRLCDLVSLVQDKVHVLVVAFHYASDPSVAIHPQVDPQIHKFS